MDSTKQTASKEVLISYNDACVSVGLKSNNPLFILTLKIKPIGNVQKQTSRLWLIVLRDRSQSPEEYFSERSLGLWESESCQW